MTPDEAIREARSENLRPLYLIAGEETYLHATVLAALRAATLVGAVPGLNEDSLVAGERSVDDALSAARTLPMMAKRRFVVVQRLERWEPRTADDGDAKPSSKSAHLDPFERLLEYAKAPNPSTTLVLVGAGLDKRRKLYVTARNQGWLVACEPLGRAELPLFAEREAARLGAKLAPGVADLVAEMVGPELGPVADAINRLSLYAGSETISEAMVGECVVRLRAATVWELVAAVGRRDAGGALAALHDVYDPYDCVRLVGLLAWSARQLLRFESALRDGAAPAQAAQQAGAPPFKARELQQQVKLLPRAALEAWLTRLVHIDRALKGGSKLSPKAVLERGILEFCSKLEEAGSSARRPEGA